MIHMVRQPLRLYDGKFMRGDVEVAPEIGNREQIELLRKAEREAEEKEKQAKERSLPVSIEICNLRFKMKCKFNCVCGHPIAETDSLCLADSINEIEDAEWEGGTIRCPECGREYEIEGEQAKLI